MKVLLEEHGGFAVHYLVILVSKLSVLHRHRIMSSGTADEKRDLKGPPGIQKTRITDPH